MNSAASAAASSARRDPGIVDDFLEPRRRCAHAGGPERGYGIVQVRDETADFWIVGNVEKGHAETEREHQRV